MGHVFLIYHFSWMLPRSHDTKRLLVLQCGRCYDLHIYIFYICLLPYYGLHLVENNNPLYWLWAHSCKFFGLWVNVILWILSQSIRGMANFHRLPRSSYPCHENRCFSISLELMQPWTWSRVWTRALLSETLGVQINSSKLLIRKHEIGCLLKATDLFCFCFS